MRAPIVAGNWKMNTTIAEAVALADAIRANTEAIGGVEIVVCPPYVSLAGVSERLRGSDVRVGAQNAHAKDRGAFTGEVSVTMLVGLVDYVIVGHSERRQHFGETDQGVNEKVLSAIANGLRPIVCVGETLVQNESGQTDAVVTGQIRTALRDVAPSSDVVVAYEPIWAIGTGRAATSTVANATIGLIRQVLADIWGDVAASQTRIQYGGSVTAMNAIELFGQPEIDGGLVGGASLKADEFTGIVRAAADTRARSGL